MAQRLAQHLIGKGLLPAGVVEEALRAMAARGGSLDTVLLEAGVVSEAGILQSVSDVSGVRLVNLADFEPNAEAAGLLPSKLARQLRLAPLSEDGEAIHVASAYPIPQSQLKDLGFVLGRKLELWVALECRIKDWQAVLYGLTLEPRFARLLASLDPTRAAPPPGDETLSRDVLERIAQGIVEEPVLLDRPKRRSDEALPAEAPARGRVPDTTFLGLPPADYPHGDAAANLAATPPRITFPGGVAPPRSAPRTPPVGTSTEPFLQPAPASRPSPERRRPLAEAPQALAMGLDPDLDFSDVNAALQARSSPARAPSPRRAPAPAPSRPMPPRFEELQALASAPPARRSAGTGVPTRPAAAAPPPPPSGGPALAPQSTWADQVPAPTPPAIPAPAAPALPDWLTSTPAPQLQTTPAGGTPIPPEAVPTPPAGRVLAVAASGLLPSPPAPSAPAAPPAEAPAPAAPRASGPVLAAPPSGPVAPAPPGLGASAAASWSLAEARASLQAAAHQREQLVGVALEYGRRAFEFVAAFAVLKGAAVGWDARGEPGASEAARAVSIPLDAASVFRTVALTRGGYVGPLPTEPLSQHYLAQLGRTPRTVFLWPVEVQSRLVAMIYGDCGPRPVSQRRLADFILFCRELPQAFHELILHRRQHARPSGVLVAPRPTPAHPAPGSAPPAPPAAGDWFDGLIALLTGPDPAERSTAMAELLRTPGASAAAVSHAFPGPTGWSRLPVVELPDPDELGPLPGALARLGEEGALALAPLLDASDSDTRYLALLTAGSLRSPALVDGVVRGLFDLEPDVSSAARAAAAALKELPRFQARLPELRAELSSTEPLRQSLAARALGVLHDRPSMEALIALTGSEDPLCAQSAAEALKDITRFNLGPQPAAWQQWWEHARGYRRVDWLVAALEAEDFDLRLAAIEELSRAFSENLGYFADSPAVERTPAVERWRAALAARPELEL